MIICPLCGNPVTSPADRPAHDVLIQSARVRGAWRWSAIASCDARIVASAESYADVIVALDYAADVLNMPSSDWCEVGHHTPRTTPSDRSTADLVVRPCLKGS